MKAFEKSQILALYNSETPPCVSIYLPLTSGLNLASFSEVLTDMAMLTRNEISMRFSLSQAERLTIRPDELPLRDILAHHKGETICLFQSPEFAGFMMLPGIYPKACRVSDSFYLKPISDCMVDQVSIFGQKLFGSNTFPLSLRTLTAVTSS